jgi:hypothetical protein
MLALVSVLFVWIAGRFRARMELKLEVVLHRRGPSACDSAQSIGRDS